MKKHANTQAVVNMKAWHTLYADVCQRRHIEACGLLLGHIDDLGNWHIKQAHPLQNICNSPVYFEFAPEDVLAVELDHPGAVIGVYHSHPGGLKVASSTDRDNMKRVNTEQQIPLDLVHLQRSLSSNISRRLRATHAFIGYRISPL